eukprot:gene9418-biopygen21222
MPGEDCASAVTLIFCSSRSFFRHAQISGSRSNSPVASISRSHSNFGITLNFYSSAIAPLERVGARDLGNPAFAPRSELPYARAKWCPMIRMASGSSLAFPTTVSGPTFLNPWRVVGGNGFCGRPPGLA